MEKKPKKKSNKWATLGIVAGLVFLVTFASSTLFTLANYPTEGHRRVEREMARIADESFKDLTNGKTESALDSKEFKDLEKTPEANYTKLFSFVRVVIEIMIYVGIVGFTYNYLRKKRVINKPVGTTVLVYTIASMPSFILVSLITSAYVAYAQPVSWVLALGIFGGLTFGVLITFLITLYFQWLYDRKHSFVVE